MYLFLAKLLYKNRYSGKIKLYARILSSYNISTMFHEYVKLSNANDLKFENLIKYSDLNQKETYIQAVTEILKEFLRFFGYNLQQINNSLSGFKETIKTYIDLIFQ